MPTVRPGRPRAAETEPRASIRWIYGGAYAELGAWAEWGGRCQEPLVATGEIVATRDPNTAAILFARRLAELREKRAANQTGAPAAASDVPTSVGAFMGYHLAAKADVKAHRTLTVPHSTVSTSPTTAPNGEAAAMSWRIFSRTGTCRPNPARPRPTTTAPKP